MKAKNRNNKSIMKGVARVPVVMQMETLECGAACLDMILAYYGRYVPLSQMRRDCGVSRDGSNAKNIILAGRTYGLEGKAFRYSAESLKTKVTFPCIIFWDRNHFIVLDGYRKGSFYLNDPAQGYISYSEEEFTAHYSGICLTFKPTEAFEAGGKPDSITGFVRDQLKGAGRIISIVVLTYLVITLIGLLLPIFPRALVDYVLDDANAKLWERVFFIGFFVIATCKIIAEWIKASYMIRLQGKMAITANSEFMWHILRMPMVFFSQRYDSDIIARKNSLELISSIFIVQGVPLILDLCSMLFYLVLMVSYSPVLSIVGIVSLAINLVITNYALKERLNLTRRQMKNSQENDLDTYIGVNMIETIKAAGVETGFFEKWAGTYAECVKSSAELNRKDSLYSLLPDLISGISSAAILCLSVLQMINGDWTMGIISAFMGYVAAYSDPAKRILAVYQEFQKLSVAIGRYEDVMQYEEDIPDEIAPFAKERTYELLKGDIEFKNVTFGYSKLSAPLISDFSMKVGAGKSIAFVGSSGSGKSTLAKLLGGLYRPWSGQILLDGMALEEIDRDILTASVASIDQNISLFSDTIAHNIKMWDEAIEDYEMILAARDAHIHDDIVERDKGYQSEVLEGGINFSGGQRQRLEIARALSITPSIIILDEATSALDAETENDVMKSIRDLGITMVIISHRLSTIRDCDEIIVLSDGKVIDRGRHEELMDRCEYYRVMITME